MGDLGAGAFEAFGDGEVGRLHPARAQEAADEGLAHAPAADDDESGHLSTPRAHGR
jgi:hypothetical protein